MIQKMYNDPKTGFQSLDKLRLKLKKEGVEVTNEQIGDVLQESRPFTLIHPARKKYPTRKTYAYYVDQQWQADLADMQSLAKENDGFRYIMTVVDVLSRYAWAVPIKQKTGAEIVKAFESIGKVPKLLQTDQGSEFYNKTVKSWLEKKGVKLFSVSSDKKAGIVERFNRTLKNMMSRYFVQADTNKYVDVLPDLMWNYNHSFHSSLKMTPAEAVQNEDKARENLYGDQPEQTSREFQIGDTVRISRVKGHFEKGYQPSWTEELFVVKRVFDTSPKTYQLKDLMGENIKGSFYGYELEKVKDTGTYEIEKVLKEKKVNGKKWQFVKWLDYPDKFNSWIEV